ncbi:hypothetical protein V6N12_012988 [Hibiscus sabdariffa]|uniref:Uncharacterized protein n=1 Tax=Hibiscus sabdariffa TaxID=183260 RepID=A0ABR2EG15_9ROSI
MPNYTKFLKDMVSRKTRIREFETVATTEACMADKYSNALYSEVNHANFDTVASFLVFYRIFARNDQPRQAKIHTRRMNHKEATTD